jgi:hypothetical protein
LGMRSEETVIVSNSRQELSLESAMVAEIVA